MMRRTVWGIVPVLALLVSFAGVSPASAQPVGSLGIHAHNCESNPGTLQDPLVVPADCAAAGGATFTVTDASGAVAGGCTIAGGESYCLVELPMGATVTVTEEPATISAGYAARENPIVYTMPPPGADGVFLVLFINVRQTADDSATRLPTTGAGTAAGDDAGLSAMGTALLLLATLGTALALRRRSVV